MAEVALVVMGNIQMHLIGQALYFTLDRRFVHVKKGQVNVRGTAEHIAFFQKRTAQIGSHNATVIADALVDSLIGDLQQDRKSTRLNSSHQLISYAVFCLKKKKKK